MRSAPDGSPYSDSRVASVRNTRIQGGTDMSEALDTSSREHCRDVIDRFLDRYWLEDRTPIATISRHRFALNNLDSWMQRHRVVTLTFATARDVRALLNSSHWDAVACGCESLLSLVAAFFKNLQDTKFRNDDPIV